MPALTERAVRETFRAIPTLETERLLMRKIVPENAEDMYAYSRLYEVTEYLTWTPHKSLRETERYIRLLTKKYADGAFWDWGINDKESGAYIGTCGFTSFDYDHNSAEIGYVLAPPFWGRGLAVEASRAVMRFGFAVFDLDRICARHIEGNDASARVMQKLGMTYGTTYKNTYYIKGSYRTVIEYAVTREEYFEKLQNGDAETIQPHKDIV